MIVMDDTTCMVWAAENLIHFYRHESCGKCTPVPRRRRLDAEDPAARSSAARARCATSTCSRAWRSNINGKTLCPFGEAEVAPVLSTLQHFRHEYEAHVREGRCPLHADWRRGA